MVTQDSCPADVALAAAVAGDTLAAAAALAAAVCRPESRVSGELPVPAGDFLSQRGTSCPSGGHHHLPWSQWTPYFPLSHVSQAVPLKPLWHRQTPVPAVPSSQAPFPKQGCPLGPGQGSQCSPKNPPQHLRTCRQRGERPAPVPSPGGPGSYQGSPEAGGPAAHRQQPLLLKHVREQTFLLPH